MILVLLLIWWIRRNSINRTLYNLQYKVFQPHTAELIQRGVIIACSKIYNYALVKKKKEASKSCPLFV